LKQFFRAVISYFKQLEQREKLDLLLLLFATFLAGYWIGHWFAGRY
jgi:type II secretory pathway component PulM